MKMAVFWVVALCSLVEVNFTYRFCVTVNEVHPENMCLTDDSIDSGLETEAPDRLATYIMMDARDRLNITLTPAGMQVLHDLATAFTHSIPDIPRAAFHGLEVPLSLQNDLGSWAKITLLSRAEVCYNPLNLLLHHHSLISQ
jgi:hypothetical protein